MIAFNSHRAGFGCDLGIGNNPDFKGNPDWTFARNGGSYAKAELFVVAKIDNLKTTPVTRLQPDKLGYAMKSTKVDYAPGEPMEFTFDFNLNGGAKPSMPYFLDWTRTGDDGKTEKGKLPVEWGKPLTVRTAMDKPGFVRITARLVDNKGGMVSVKRYNRVSGLVFDGGAGVEIAKIQQATPEPADFDAFWKKQRELLSAVPLKPELTELKSNNPKVKIYAVSVPCAGPRPMTGYLTVPADDSKKYPAQASYQGYGFHLPRAPKNGPDNRIVLVVNAHGFDLEKPKAYYDQFGQSIRSNGKIYAWDPVQNANPETAYFRGMALRVMRSLDFLKSLPQWNGKDLSVEGGSQGGLQTIWAAGLDPAVTRAIPVVPWCCDLNGKSIKRLGGWLPPWTPALGYFDAVNHGKRIRCFTWINRAGLGDYTCPPSGVASLYNGMKCPKSIVWVQDSTHGYIAPNAQKFTVESK